MSRDLSFWKAKKGTCCTNRAIYKSLSMGDNLSCIDELPSNQIIESFNKVFDEWVNHNNEYYEKGNECFELFITEQFARVDCHEMTADSINKIIDIMLDYGCPLYDSAIDTRFDET